MSAGSPDLSLVLTFHDEAELLEASVRRVLEFLASTRLGVELLLIDDHSGPATQEALARLERTSLGAVDATIVRNDARLGRGACLDAGFGRARAPVAACIDTDLEIPVHYLLPAYLEMRAGDWDLVIGTRTYVPAASRLPRRLLGRASQLGARLILGHPYRDTLAGLKLVRTERYRMLQPHVRSRTWFWDTEVVYLAHVNGFRIYEMSLTVHPQRVRPSSVRWADGPRYLRDLSDLRARTSGWKQRRRREPES